MIGNQDFSVSASVSIKQEGADLPAWAVGLFEQLKFAMASIEATAPGGKVDSLELYDPESCLVVSIQIKEKPMSVMMRYLADVSARRKAEKSAAEQEAGSLTGLDSYQ